MRIFQEYLIETDLPVIIGGMRSRMNKNFINRRQKLNRFKLIVGMSRGWVLDNSSGSFINIFPIVKNLVDSYIPEGNVEIALNSVMPAHQTFADYSRTFFAGLFGYGMTSAYAENQGAVWFAHFEEVAKLAAVTQPAGTVLPTQTPDLVSLDSSGTLSWLESKGSFSNDGNIWSRLVTAGFKQQILPWIRGEINGTKVFHGRTVGTHLSLTGSRVLSAYVDYPSRLGSAHYPKALLLPHYSRWLRLFGGSFWPLAARMNDISLNKAGSSMQIEFNTVRLGKMEFVVSVANGPYCITPCFEGEPIYIGIERRIFNGIIDLISRSSEDNLANSAIVEVVRGIEQTMRLMNTVFEDEIGEINISNNNEANVDQEALNYLRRVRTAIDLCAFADGTIAFYGEGSQFIISGRESQEVIVGQ